MGDCDCDCDCDCARPGEGVAKVLATLFALNPAGVAEFAAAARFCCDMLGLENAAMLFLFSIGVLEVARDVTTGLPFRASAMLRFARMASRLLTLAAFSVAAGLLQV